MSWRDRLSTTPARRIPGQLAFGYLPHPISRWRATAAGLMYSIQRAIRRRRFGWRTSARAVGSSFGAAPEIALLIANQRSGTSLFCSLFEQLPGCGSIYEALNPAKSRLALVPADAPEVVGYLKRAAAGEGQQFVLTKAFYENLEGRADINELSHLMPSSTFVVLWRRDQLAAYVSLLLARRTGNWHHRTAGTDLPSTAASESVHVDPAEFLAFREKQVDDTAKAIHALKGTGRLHVICYEDLARDQLGVMNNFARKAFGPIDLPSSYDEWFHKPNRVLSDKVTNWVELQVDLTDRERYHPDPLASI